MKKVRKLSLKRIGLFLVLLVLVQSAQAKLNPAVMPVLKQQRKFAFKILREMHKADPNASTVFSPVGLYTLFALLYEGSAGPTERFADTVLQLDASSRGTYEEAIPYVVQALTKAPGVTFANGVWFSRKNPPTNTYRDRLAHYLAHVGTFTGDKKADSKAVNKWSLEKGNEQPLVSTEQWGTESPSVFLANVVRFTGKWAKPFLMQETTAERKDKLHFMTDTGRGMSTTFLSGPIEGIPYAKKDEYQAIWLPYESNTDHPRVSMLLVLPPVPDPKQPLPFETTLAKMDGFLSAPTKDWQIRDLEVVLPATHIDTNGKSLQDVLNTIGKDRLIGVPGGLSRMASWKTNEAPFFGLTLASSLQITKDGTQASSSSTNGVLIGSSASGVMSASNSIVFNRPFGFVVIDAESNSIIYMGWVSNP